jgi:hypothetical protein
VLNRAHRQVGTHYHNKRVVGEYVSEEQARLADAEFAPLVEISLALRARLGSENALLVNLEARAQQPQKRVSKPLRDAARGDEAESQNVFDDPGRRSELVPEKCTLPQFGAVTMELRKKCNEVVGKRVYLKTPDSRGVAKHCQVVGSFAQSRFELRDPVRLARCVVERYRRWVCFLARATTIGNTSPVFAFRGGALR